MTIQEHWDRFDRWATRYARICQHKINALSAMEYFDFPDYLFACKWYEYGAASFEAGITPEKMRAEVRNRIRFLRGYFVDVSFDGAEFMDRTTNFLSLQYPSKCNDVMTFWFEQSLESEEIGAYHGFQEYDVSLFCRSPTDIDFESIRNIMPFDRFFVRRPCGAIWDKGSVTELVGTVREDLGLSRRKRLKIRGEDTSVLSINFNRRFE